MKEVLISLFVASALAMLSDVLLSNDKTKKAARFCIGVAIALIVIVPIAMFLKNADVNAPTDVAFCDMIDYSENKSELESDIESYLEKQNVKAKVWVFTYEKEIMFAVFEAEDKDAEYVRKVVSAVLKIDGGKVLQYG